MSRLILIVTLATVLSVRSGEPHRLKIELQVLLKREDPGDRSLWFHPRVAIGVDGKAIMTVQKHLGRSDHYSGLSVMTSTDQGRTWTMPQLVPELDWVEDSRAEGVNIAVADVTPGFHAETKKVIAVGAQVRYSPDGKQLQDVVRAHQTAYAVMSPDGEWTPWRRIEMPVDEEEFDFARSACAQWLVEEDGSVLLPFYIGKGTKTPFATTVVRCDFDGENLEYRGHGQILRLETMRGLYEPSLVKHDGRYFLTMRNDERGYLAVSDDGMEFSDPEPWKFDDGSELGSYNTQQHWLELAGKLYLVYTRRGAGNDHVMRHRAPLFVAEVDTERLRVIRATERIVVPERGATLGNFGVTSVSDTEAWVTVGEGNVDGEAGKHGADGSLFLARVLSVE